ncbi:MAG: AMP-binding protein [Brevibacterium linens]
MSELSYSSGTSTEPLLGITIAEHIKRTAARNPEALALVDRHSNRRWTYSDFDRDTDALAIGLLERGVKKGDRVGIWAQNVGEWALVQYATAKIGAILVNVNPAYRSHELEFVVEQSGMSLMISQIVAPPHSDFHAIATEVAAKVPSLDLIFLDTVSEDLIGGVTVGERESSLTSSSWDARCSTTKERSTRCGCSRSSTISRPMIRSTSNTPPARPDSPRV